MKIDIERLIRVNLNLDKDLKRRERIDIFVIYGLLVFIIVRIATYSIVQISIQLPMLMLIPIVLGAVYFFLRYISIFEFLKSYVKPGEPTLRYIGLTEDEYTLIKYHYLTP